MNVPIAELRARFAVALLERARVIAAVGGCAPADTTDFVARAVASFALFREPVDAGWHTELAKVSVVAADIAGVGSTHVNHLTARVLDIDELYRRMVARASP